MRNGKKVFKKMPNTKGREFLPVKNVPIFVDGGHTTSLRVRNSRNLYRVMQKLRFERFEFKYVLDAARAFLCVAL